MRDFLMFADEARVHSAERFGRIILPPRTGKTAIAACVARELRLPATFLVPTKTLVEQTAREVESWLGEPVGVLYSDRKEPLPGGTNVSTYAQLERCSPAMWSSVARAPLIFADEAHHTLTIERFRLLESRFSPEALRVALTATPDYDEVRALLPQIVFNEIVVAGAGLVGAREVEGANWLQVEDVPAEPSLLATLDRGEAAAIPLAERLGATLLADDVRAREVARDRGLVVIGHSAYCWWRRRRGCWAPSVQSSCARRRWACLFRYSAAKQFLLRRLNPTVAARASVRFEQQSSINASKAIALTGSESRSRAGAGNS